VYRVECTIERGLYACLYCAVSWLVVAAAAAIDSSVVAQHVMGSAVHRDLMYGSVGMVCDVF
jgi:hypothetical protein